MTPVLTNPYREESSYIQAVLALGPVVFLAPMAPSGTDVSGNGHDGTVTGGTPTVASILDGDLGFTFNGTSQDVDIANFTGVNLTTFTLMCWIKTTATAGNFWGRSGDANAPYSMIINGTKLSGVTKAPSQSLITGATTINDDVWHHVAFKRDNASTPTLGASTLHVDGVQDVAPTIMNTPQSVAAGLSVGSRGTSAFTAASILAPSLHNVALTAAQIAALAQLR